MGEPIKIKVSRDTATTPKVPEQVTKSITISEKTEKFVQNNALIVLVIVLVVITILAIWLIGSKNGDSIFSGLKLPPGFPTYVIRNLFTSLAIIIIGVAVAFSIKTSRDFDSTIIIVMFSMFLGLVIALEANIQNRQDWNGAAITVPIAMLALGFVLFFTWRTAVWVRILLIVGIIWFLFLFIEVIAINSLNRVPNT